MRHGWMIAPVIAGALLVGGNAGCAEDDESSKTTTTTEAAANARTSKSASAAPTKAKPDAELRRLRKEFAETWTLNGKPMVSWWPYFDEIEGVFGGWLYIKTLLSVDEDNEAAKSICSAGLGLGNSYQNIDPFYGVSVYGKKNQKIK